MSRAKWFNLLMSIGVTLLIVLAIGSVIPSDYEKQKEHRCTVVGKEQMSGGYKYPGKFYLVIKEERGITLDITVRASTYNTSKPGDIKYFDLSEREIQQDRSMTRTTYCVLGMLLTLIGMIIVFLLFAEI